MSFMMSVIIDYALYEQHRDELEFINESSEKSRYKCEKCCKILLQPKQTACGTRYCSPCIEKWEKNESKLCPSCENEKAYFSSDRATEREILKMEIKCINKMCKDVIAFKDLRKHLNNCNYRKEKCINCSETYLFSEKDEHRSKCKKEVIICDKCNRRLMRHEMEEIHMNVNNGDYKDLCENLNDQCPNQCSNEIFTNLKMHLEICPKSSVPCPLKDLGCQKVLSRESMILHMKENEIHHWHLLGEMLKKTQSEQKKMNEYILQNQKKIETDFLKLKNVTITSTKNLSSSTQESLKMKNTVKKIEEDFQSLRELVKNNHVQGILNRSLPNYATVVNNSTNLPSQGTYTWTITDVRAKIRDAKLGYQTQIASDMFYINTPGYRMRIKVYPNGDGIANGEYLSAFFAISKGEFDDVLPWPFSKKVTLAVVRNNQVVRDSIVTMRPDNNEACYGKPENQFNVAAGQPRFIKINEILNSNKYIEDDNLIIKMTVF